MKSFRAADLPYTADWYAVLFRWLAVVALVFSLAWSGKMDLPVGGILAALALFNALIMVLAAENRRLPAHRAVNLVVDISASLGLFVLSGGVTGAAPWAGVVAILSAAVYVPLYAALLTAVGMSLAALGLTLLQPDGMLNLQPVLWLAAFNMGAGLLFGWVGQNLVRRARAIYQANLRRRREVELKAQQVERKRLQTFYSLVETLSASHSYHVVTESALDLCISALGGAEQPAGKMVCATLLFGERGLRVEAARRFSPRDMRLTFPGEQGALHQALNHADPQFVKAPHTDPELSKVILLEDCQVGLLLSLRRGMDVFGVMLFAHPDAAFFSPERVELLEMISHQAVVALQNAQLYQALEEEKERLVSSQEEARKQLARDLHDGPIQSVASVAMRLEVARHLLQNNDPHVPQELQEVEELARRTTRELRHMLFTLRPLSLENSGLDAALQAMAQKMQETYRQAVRVEVEQAVVDRLETAKQSVIFYLVEEAVNNARKHAQANLILVRLYHHKGDSGVAVLEVLDNGRGFDVQAVLGSYDQRGSLGMVNLQERTDLVNGLLNINSLPGKGTRIQVLIPLDANAADRLHRGEVTA